MRNAPSVSYPVGRSFLRTLLHGLAMVSGWGVCGAWAMLARTDEPARWAVGLSSLLVTGVLAWSLAYPSRGRVRWDGQDWFWSHIPSRAAAEELRGRVCVRLDWQRGMLLEFVSLPDDTGREAGGPPAPGLSLPGNRRWLWLEQNASPPHWNALRRAAWSEAGNPSRVSA